MPVISQITFPALVEHAFSKVPSHLDGLIVSIIFLQTVSEQSDLAVNLHSIDRYQYYWYAGYIYDQLNQDLDSSSINHLELQEVHRLSEAAVVDQILDLVVQLGKSPVECHSQHICVRQRRERISDLVNSTRLADINSNNYRPSHVVQG